MRDFSSLYPGIEAFWLEMERTPQNPQHHGEGDVLIHTRMVVEALTRLPAFSALDAEQQKMLLLAAALHDVGKPRTTRMEDGAWVSPSHSSVGAHIARQFLWQNQNQCGNEAAFRFREGVCSLIRRHGMPIHALDQPDGEMKLAKFAESPATVEMVCLLAEADILGRIASDSPEWMERVQLTAELAKEDGCYTSALPFSSNVTKRAWFSGRNVHPSQPLYDVTWGEVILMSALPGTGKDTWIQNHCDLPMISMDAIRKEWHYDAAENQTPIVKEARERAKQLLRKKQPFVWNATNLTEMVRGEQISLFESYGASVRIVYLETDWKTNQERNRNRLEAVPQEKLERMLDILEPPQPWEARTVERIWR